MSKRNVEVFSRAIDAYNRRDLDALLEIAQPEIEWSPALDMRLAGEATTYRGHDGVRRLFRIIDDALDDLHAEVSQVRDLGERLVAAGRLRVRGRESGAPIESAVGLVVDFEDGKVARVQTFLDPSEAWEVAGLRD